MVVPREFRMYSHCSFRLFGWLAKRLAMVIIASGIPPHFFKISVETDLKCGGQVPPEPNILLKNSLLASWSVRAFIL